MTHFLLNPIFTRVKVKIKNLLKRNLPTHVGSAERNFSNGERSVRSDEGCFLPFLADGGNNLIAEKMF